MHISSADVNDCYSAIIRILSSFGMCRIAASTQASVDSIIHDHAQPRHHWTLNESIITFL